MVNIQEFLNKHFLNLTDFFYGDRSVIKLTLIHLTLNNFIKVLHLGGYATPLQPLEVINGISEISEEGNT